MSDPARKMSLTQATMLVAGNMIGTGLFLLPVSLAAVGSISILGWLVAAAGAAALGLIFAKLGELDPKEGGPYAYARDFLGPYVGFQTNFVYWFGNWIGNIAVAIAAVGYLAEFIPAITHPPASVVAAAAVIWILTFANILGPRVVGALETWTMALALVPILGIAFFGWFWFDRETFLAGWNASGGSGPYAVSRAASMALWAFMGIESAAVSAGVIENPKRNIPLATLMGLGLSAVVYILSSSVIMGIIPNAELQKSHAPFAEAARLAVGTWGMAIISICAILKSVGSLGGWMLLVGQSAKAAADDGMFPSAFARLNRHGVPGRGLVIVGVLMTIVLFATMSPTIAQQFGRIIDLAVILVVVPYLYASVAVVKVIFDHQLPARTFQTFKWVAMAAVAYCLWAVMGGDPKTVVHALVALLLSVPLYPFFIRSMEAARRKRSQQEGLVAPPHPPAPSPSLKVERDELREEVGSHR
jgi:arginine:agmatine antiporter